MRAKRHSGAFPLQSAAGAGPHKRRLHDAACDASAIASAVTARPRRGACALRRGPAAGCSGKPTFRVALARLLCAALTTLVLPTLTCCADTDNCEVTATCHAESAHGGAGTVPVTPSTTAAGRDAGSPGVPSANNNTQADGGTPRQGSAEYCCLDDADCLQDAPYCDAVTGHCAPCSPTTSAGCLTPTYCTYSVDPPTTARDCEASPSGTRGRQPAGTIPSGGLGGGQYSCVGCVAKAQCPGESICK
ncbi:MAG: hypothetical protein RJA70_4262, partial [Pseudomonadota bacterium]